MSEDKAYLRRLSQHLSRTLDEIGLNTLTVKRRRRTFLQSERIRNVYGHLAGNQWTVYHFGSQVEGTTTPGLKSDLDSLYSMHCANVIGDWAEWKQGMVNMLMLQEDTAPGYCRLQLLRPDTPMASENVLTEQAECDSSGRVLLTNKVVTAVLQELNMARNGPAGSRSEGPAYLDEDIVYALKCSHWPEQAAEFIRRHRRHGWPSKHLVRKAVKHGVFLVPAGHKMSLTEHLEWRISASLAERCLMFSLNIVHIKCYVLLKMLMKTFVTPCVENSISSYHCKTALLYCTEKTESRFWRDDNLVQCVTECLALILTWVSDGFCPHFIIAEENLFAGKVTVKNKASLQTLLKDLIRGIEHSLLQVRSDDLGHKLKTKSIPGPSLLSDHSLPIKMRLVAKLEFDRQKNLGIWLTTITEENNSTETSSLILSLHQKIKILKDLFAHSDKRERQAIQAFIQFLSGWLGSTIASISLSRKMEVPRQAKRLLRIGTKYDTASILKLASIFYCTGEFCKAETTLLEQENKFHKHNVFPVCSCYDKEIHIRQEFCPMMFAIRNEKTRARCFAHCVRFAPQEIHCAPQALRHELVRSMDDDVKYRKPIYDNWMDMAAVDCLPYLYFLQYMTYRQLEKPDPQARALHNLDKCIREENDFSHLETAWNLLGQCMELEQKPEVAMTCYRSSIAIRPRNNAANSHMKKLSYTHIRDGCSPPHRVSTRL